MEHKDGQGKIIKIKKTSALKSFRFSKPHLLAFVLVFVVIGGIFLLRSQAATTPPIKGIGILRLGGGYPYASGYERYDTVIVGEHNAADIAAISGPSKKCIYRNATSVNSVWNSGIPWSIANSNGWLLKDKSGNLLINRGFPENNVIDLRNTAAQASWAQHVYNSVTASRVNCVFIDDIVGNLTGLTGVSPSNILQSGYATEAEQQDAIVQFMNYGGNYLKSRGIYVLGNTNDYISGHPDTDNGLLTQRFWQRIGPNISGLMSENWLQRGGEDRRASTGPEWWNHWNGWQGLVATAQSVGADFHGLSYGNNSSIETMRYGKGSFMLDWNGGGGTYMFEVTNGDPWNPEWTTDIGQPSGSKFQVGNGWRRNYTGGTVVVNPSGSSSQTFNLGANYKKADGSTVSSVTLAPTTALILSSTTTSPTLPVINFSASPTTIAAGATSTLSWSSTNASSCTASGAWSGSKATSGTQAVTPTATSIYNLSCTGSGGSANASVTVTVSASTALPPTWTDIAAGKTATASSIEASGLEASKANDSNSSTRWASSYADNQWWQVDLGSDYSVSSAAVNWETATASSYKIQLSRDGNSWTDVAAVTGNTATGWKETAFSAATARYVRVQAQTRATTFGFSAWDIWVKGTPQPTALPVITQNIIAGDTLSGIVNWTVTTNATNIASISFDMDGNKSLSTIDTTAPFSRNLDTRQFTSGQHELGLTLTLTDGTVTWENYQIGFVTFSNQAAKRSDLNGDNAVNVLDLSVLLTYYGTSNTTADINKDGTVNVLDMSILLSDYGT